MTQSAFQSALRSLALATILLVPALARPLRAAHPIPIVPVTAYATRHRLTLRADVFVEDMKLFHELELVQIGEEDYLPAPAIREGIELHKKFLLDNIIVRDVNGKKLVGKIADVVEFDIPPEGVSADSLMEHFVSYQMEYDLSSPPEFLTFTQTMGADRLLQLPSEVSLRIMQSGGETMGPRILRPRKPQTFRFDWNSPPLSQDASDAELKKWYEQRRQDTLGIDQYGSVYSFVYITPREVRHEILIPLGTLESDFKIKRKDPAFLEVEEQQAGRALVAKAFEYNNPVHIDGLEVKAIVDRIDFYGLKLKDFAMRVEKRRVSTASCRVGIILRYPTKGLPQQVGIKWDKFTRNILRVDSVVFAPDKPFKHTFTKTNSELKWKSAGAANRPVIEVVGLDRPLWVIPLFSCACLAGFPVLLLVVPALRRSLPASFSIALLLCAAGWLTWPYAQWQRPAPLSLAPAPTESKARSLFATLHKNTYRAFDYQSESDVYDALSKSVDGDLLRDLYLQINSRLKMQEQGGAIARVEEVKIVDGHKSAADKVRRPGFGYECRWTVSGTVEHWGHIHNRINQYVAKFAVEPRDDTWKITDLEITDEQRVRFRTRLRDF